jgi:hypothetical protein
MQRVIGFCSSSSKAWLFFATFLHHSKKVATLISSETATLLQARDASK